MIFVDSHVHIHDCFDVALVLDSALKNFGIVADSVLSTKEAKSFVLLLAERKSENWFKQIATKLNTSKNNTIDIAENWKASRNSQNSFKVEKGDCANKTIFIVNGVQAVTVEKIEVLGLYTNGEITDGLTLKETVSQIEKAGGIAVFPWGVGKWIGRRGAIVQHFLTQNYSKKVYLGDNGGRPRAWPTPEIFIEAGDKGFIILPGSDPLPLKPEAARVGSFGFYINDSLSDGDDPTEKLKKNLLSKQIGIVPFGNLLSNLRFAFNQIRLRLA